MSDARRERVAEALFDHLVGKSRGFSGYEWPAPEQHLPWWYAAADAAISAMREDDQQWTSSETTSAPSAGAGTTSTTSPIGGCRVSSTTPRSSTVPEPAASATASGAPDAAWLEGQIENERYLLSRGRGSRDTLAFLIREHAAARRAAQ